MAATEVMGFVGVTANGEMLMRTREQYAAMMLAGFDVSRRDCRVEQFRLLDSRGDALRTIDDALFAVGEKIGLTEEEPKWTFADTTY